MKHRILYDFDNVLMDTEKLRTYLSDSVVRAAQGKITRENFLSSYDKGKTNEILDVGAVAKDLARFNSLTPGAVEKIFYGAPFKTFLFPGALDLLRQTKNTSMIYSAGDEGYQPTKIRDSGVVDIIGEKNLIITRNKTGLLPEIFQRLRQESIKNITIVDDRSNILDVALAEGKKTGIHVTPVWMKYGKYTEAPKRSEVAIAHSLAEFSQRFVGYTIEGSVQNQGRLK